MPADSYDGTKDPKALLTAVSSAPARRAIPVTPSDTKDVTNATGDAAATYAKYLYVGVSGDLTVVLAADQSASGAGTGVLYKAHPVGYFPQQVRRVMATGTTAQSIVGHYDQ